MVSLKPSNPKRKKTSDKQKSYYTPYPTSYRPIKSTHRENHNLHPSEICEIKFPTKLEDRVPINHKWKTNSIGTQVKPEDLLLEEQLKPLLIQE